MLLAHVRCAGVARRPQHKLVDLQRLGHFRRERGAQSQADERNPPVAVGIRDKLKGLARALEKIFDTCFVKFVTGRIPGRPIIEAQYAMTGTSEFPGQESQCAKCAYEFEADGIADHDGGFAGGCRRSV